MPLPTRTIDRELLLDLSYGDTDDDCGWVVKESKIIDTWRWGTIHSLVLQNIADGTYWGITYRETGGDESHNSIKDLEDPAKLYPMVAEKVTNVEFRDMKESDATT